MAAFRELIVKRSGLDARKDQNKSMDWFREKALQIKKVNTAALIDTSEPFKRVVTLSETSIGKMYMFTYDAKLKHKLPFWDVYPLIFPINYYGDSFLGINLHYLSIHPRIALLDALMTETINNDKMNKTTKLKISYEILNGSAQLSAFKPCVKKYLFDHVKSNFLYISPDEWWLAASLPTQRFVSEQGGRSQTTVSSTRVWD